jgi:N-acyl-L-homoserine lactone synthetase
MKFGQQNAASDATDGAGRRASRSPPAPVWTPFLQSVCPSVLLNRGDALREKGQFYTDMFLLLDGSIEVDFKGARPKKILTVPAGGLPIGEISFLRGVPATATVTASQPCRALIINDQVLHEVESWNAEAAVTLLRYLAEIEQERTSENLLFGAKSYLPNRGSAIEVRLCRNAGMLETAQRLRYRVYCEELGRKSPFADHQRKIITDEFDSFGHTFIALENERIVGTLRANIARDGSLGLAEELYGMRSSPHHPGATGICTKFIVEKSKRGSPVAMKLISAVVQYGLRREIKECYIDCVPTLLHYYRALGFKISGQKFLHRENGLSYPMVLDLDRHGRRLGEEQGVREYLKLFAKAQSIRFAELFRRRRK